jgi:Mg-chelatase subunit ChlD
VSKADEPLSVVLCLDRSGSMYGTPTANLNTAAKQFIDNLGVSDAAEIIDFSSEASVVCGFTNDKAKLKAAIDQGVANGSTALYDSIGLGASELKNVSGRKFMIALTDGYENASRTYTTQEAAAEAVNKTGIAAHMIGIGSGVDTASLDFIASATNGEFLSSPSSAQLAAQFNYILKLMQNLMVISYRSRENRTVGEIAVYLNYGSLTGSVKRKYGG